MVIQVNDHRFDIQLEIIGNLVQQYINGEWSADQLQRLFYNIETAILNEIKEARKWRS